MAMKRKTVSKDKTKKIKPRVVFKRKDHLNVPEGDIVVDNHVEPLGESKDIEFEDFIQTVYLNIKGVYGLQPAEEFLANPEFTNYKKYNPILQRLIVNRVLTRKLLKFRAKNDVPVVDIIYCLIPDGDNSVWLDVFQKVVLPFIAYHKVKL